MITKHLIKQVDASWSSESDVYGSTQASLATTNKNTAKSELSVCFTLFHRLNEVCVFIFV